MEKIISKNLITAIPGIGFKYAQRLNAAGIKKVSVFHFTKINPKLLIHNHFDVQKMNKHIPSYMLSAR